MFASITVDSKPGKLVWNKIVGLREARKSQAGGRQARRRVGRCGACRGRQGGKVARPSAPRAVPHRGARPLIPSWRAAWRA